MFLSSFFVSTAPFQPPAARSNASRSSTDGTSRIVIVTSLPSGRESLSNGFRAPRVTRARIVSPIAPRFVPDDDSNLTRIARSGAGNYDDRERQTWLNHRQSKQKQRFGLLWT